MASISSKDTKPELKVRKYLYRSGFRYRINKKISGYKPDLVLPKYKVAIFVHGCFWHRHENCKLAYDTNSRTEVWLRKFRENKLRDCKVRLKLQMSGWRIATVWECCTRNEAVFSEEMQSLVTWIRSDCNEYETKSLKS